MFSERICTLCAFGSCCLLFHFFGNPHTCFYLHFNEPLSNIMICCLFKARLWNIRMIELKKDKNVKLPAMQNWRYWAASYSGSFKLFANFLQQWWCSQKQVIRWRLAGGRKFQSYLYDEWLSVCWGRRQVRLPCYHTWQKAWNSRQMRHSTLEALHSVIDIFQVMLKQIGVCIIETPYTVYIHVESSHNLLCIGSLLIDKHISAC